jgi:hypothetical protein
MEAGLGCDEYNKQDLVLKIVPFEPCLLGIVLQKALGILGILSTLISPTFAKLMVA